MSDVYRGWVLGRARTLRYEAGWRWDSRRAYQHWYGSMHLWVVAAGSGVLLVDGRPHPYARGSCFVLRTWQHMRTGPLPDGALMIHAAGFDLPDAATLPDATLPPVHRSLLDFGFFEGLCRRLTDRWRIGRHREAQTWLEAIAAELAAQDREARHPGDPGGGRRGGVTYLLDAMREAPWRRWSMAEVAAVLGLSVSQARRVFRRHAGCAPREAWLRARTEAAEDLLLSTDLPQREIARRLGYCDEFAFSRQFHRRTGIAPSAYRERPDGRGAGPAGSR